MSNNIITMAKNLRKKLINTSNVQIFINPDSVIFKKINKNTIEQKFVYDKNNLHTLSYNAIIDPTNIVDIIFIGNISCKSIPVNNINNSEINNILQKTNCNTAFFRKNKQSTEISEMNINNFAISIVENLLKTGIRINSVFSWPLWIVNQYFSVFPLDTQKFGCFMFVVSNDECVDVIPVINKTDILCNRHFKKENFAEIEIANTMKYVSEQTGIKLDEIAICNLNEDTISSFTSQMNSSLSFVSSVLPLELKPELTSAKQITKTVLKLISGSLMIGITWQFVGILFTNSEIVEYEKISNSVPLNIISEMNLWHKVKDNIIEPMNYELLISSILKNSESSNILELDIETRKNNCSVNIKMLNGVVEQPYSKNFVFQNCKFKMSVSEQGIVCDGKYC